MKKRLIRRQLAAGFTLVEVLFALSMLAIVVGVAYSALSQIISTKRILDDKRDVTVVANAVLGRVVRELQMSTSGTALLPPPNENFNGSIGGSMLGESTDAQDGNSHDRITFLAQEAGQYLPDGGTHTGLVQITYRVEKDKEAEQNSGQEVFSLIRDEIPYIQNPGINDSTAWNKARQKAYEKAMIFPITNRLVSFKIRYYDNQQETWVDEWGKRGSSSDSPRIILLSIALRSPLGEVSRFTTSVPIGLNRNLNRASQ